MKIEVLVDQESVAENAASVIANEAQAAVLDRDSVLPAKAGARIAIEQASTFGRERYIGASGRVLGMTTFGASAAIKELQRKFGFEPERPAAVAKGLRSKG